MVINTVVQQALTTPSVDGDVNYTSFQQEGFVLLKSKIRTLLREMNKDLPDADEGKAVINNALSNEVLGKVFDNVIFNKLPLRIGNLNRKNIPTWMKAGIVRALYYVLMADEQEHASNTLLQEIVRFTPVEKNPLEKMHDIISQTCEKTVDDFISFQRIGGTGNKPLLRAILNYSDIEVVIESVGSKKRAKIKACEMYLFQLKQRTSS